MKLKNTLALSLAAVMAAGLPACGSSAAAASAAIAHLRDRVLGSGDRWVTMGVPSDGSYGIPEGLLFGFPCTTKDGRWEIVQGLELSDFARAPIAKSVAELESERAHVAALLG